MIQNFDLLLIFYVMGQGICCIRFMRVEVIELFVLDLKDWYSGKGYMD